MRPHWIWSYNLICFYVLSFPNLSIGSKFRLDNNLEEFHQPLRKAAIVEGGKERKIGFILHIFVAQLFNRLRVKWEEIFLSVQMVVKWHQRTQIARIPVIAFRISTSGIVLQVRNSRHFTLWLLRKAVKWKANPWSRNHWNYRWEILVILCFEYLTFWPTKSRRIKMKSVIEPSLMP